MPNASADSTIPSPSSRSRRASSSCSTSSSGRDSPAACSSVGGASASSASARACSAAAPSSVRASCCSTLTSSAAPLCSRSRSSANDDRLPGPAGLELVVPDAFLLDALLEQDDALEQRLAARRAARHVHLDADDLVDALGDRVRVPVGAAAVGARAHRDHVLRIGHLLVETLAGGRHLSGDEAHRPPDVDLATL